jgi:hypothetical protein
LAFVLDGAISVVAVQDSLVLIVGAPCICAHNPEFR